MASNIGIKIANGEFYPIMAENSLVRKRLILTTVHDNQPSVQIDLYRSAANTMTDAQYIGSVVVENIKPKPKGEPSIEMIISSNTNGEIIADAIDLDTSAGGEHYVLTVSLKSLDQSSRDMDVPDFELESNEEPPSSLYKKAQKVRKEEKKSSKAWIVILIILLLLGLLALWLFLFGGLDTIKSLTNRTAVAEQARPEPPVRQEPPPPEPPKPADPPKAADPPPVIEAPAAPPVQSQPLKGDRLPDTGAVSAVIPSEGTSYRIRWGDTLWDISETYYRDPWQYPRIARFNNIRNPNLIYSGRTIRIPPKD